MAHLSQDNEISSESLSFQSNRPANRVRIIKAMIFPVVVYGCESWTIKKAKAEELMLLNCGAGEDS